MRVRLCASAVGKLITVVFFAADIVLGIWIYRSYRETKEITSSEPLISAYDMDADSIQNGAGRKDTGASGGNTSGGGGSSSKKEEQADDTKTETKAAEVSSKNYSTEKRPAPEEFDWYVNDVYKNDIPANASKLRDYDDLTGGWKAMIYYDIENKNNAKSYDIMNITLGGWEDDSSLTIDWYRMYYEFEYEDEESWDDSVFKGSFNMGVLAAHGDNDVNIFLKTFYELGGKQYAVGYMDTITGIPAVVAMVRP
ncbi:MAG: hypothetical protein K6D94_03975 [Clostridiales bacterium]|nr:hypothetical protein [Clostridiales bacterium]